MKKSDSWLSRGSTDSREVAGYYDDWADSYDKSLSEWEYKAPNYNAALLRRYSTLKGPVFDAGCGTGLTGRALSAEGFDDLTGSDISPKSVEIALKTRVYNKVIVLDLQNFPFPFTDNYFAAVNCVGVLTYIDKLSELMHEFIRITKPGGIIAFTHRDDLIEKINFKNILEKIEIEKKWEKVFTSEPQPYLPRNDDFADKINVVYFACRVL